MNLPRFAFPASLVGTAVGLAVIIKDRSQGVKYENDVKFSGRTVIITGANSGIGKATALEMAKRGGRVIMACRDVRSAFKVREEIIEETYNPNVEVKHLDLASLESITKFVEEVNRTEKRLDVLVNNAGLMNIGSKRQITRDGFEMHLGVNFLGPFLLTNLLLPKMQQCRPARVVNLTTVSINKANIDFEDFNLAKGYDPHSAYPRSKLALTSFTQAFNLKYKDSGVTSYAVYPGIAATKLSKGLAKSTISSVFFKPATLFTRKPENAAQTVLYCCLEPGIEDQSDLCLKDMQPMKWTTELSTADSDRLWRIADRWTGLNQCKQAAASTAS